ncbi:hypothetical protein [Synechococcus elongatus]|uniref:hypothetical protein n=1 Tax=Synechococcus elongatus TaxID=32046 RepID=UPI001374BB6D|nr:hypothetical protein [Synechococcus elongatus]
MTRLNGQPVLTASFVILLALTAIAPAQAESSTCPTKQSQTTCPAPQNNNHQGHH